VRLLPHRGSARTAPRASAFLARHLLSIRPSSRPVPPPAPPARSLWRGTVSKARENGYTHVTAQAGSSTVRRILHEQLGFDEVASINYSSWEYAEPPISAAEAGGGGGGGGGDDEHADAAHGHGGRVSKVLAELALRNPTEYDRLSISIRRVPSNLYV
jgi:hypothetical protein